MTQLKKLAQGFQGQEGAGQLGDIDEDDEVPGEMRTPLGGGTMYFRPQCRPQCRGGAQGS